MMKSIKNQYEMGAISRESVIRNSPYTSDVDRELELIDKANENKSVKDLTI